MGESTQVDVQSVGTITSEVTANGRQHTIQVEEVTYVPGLKTNLLSEILLRKKSFNTTLGDDLDSREEGIFLIVYKISRQVMMKQIER